jgi:two-component system cell cycle response regulator DivK
VKLLYAEDNDDNVYLVKLRLGEIEGHEVLVAPDGEEACRMARDVRPDVILMDLELPVLTGWDAARRLKSDPETAMIPIVALSAHALSGTREGALAAGCDEFDTKPIDFDRLIAKLTRLAGGA